MPPFTLANPPTLADPTRYAFSHVAEVPAGTKLVFIAGQGGGASDGSHGDDFGAEVRQTIANLSLAVESAGGTLASIVKVTILVVDFDETRHAVLTAALEDAFRGTYPTSTLIPVPRLAGALMQIEIDAVAVVAIEA